MASYFNLALDTTGPSNVTIVLNSGDAYTSDQLVTAAIGTSDGDTTGYQMKIWGNVDTTYNANIQDTEIASAWITFGASQQVKLLTGDGTKTIYIRLRDSVWNESSQQSDAITLNTTNPVATISSGPSVSVISKIASKDEATFQFTGDVEFKAYKVKVVSSTGATHDTGTEIPTAGGSTNMSDTGSFPSATPISCTIKGVDLESASAGDATKIVKVFIQNVADLWSV